MELVHGPQARVSERLRAWAGAAEGVERVVAQGHPAVESARVADERKVDLIVMSTKGATGADWLLLGSVTERVCRMANVPVLALRQEDA